MSPGKERKMVPDATFTSYYGRPIVKASPWQKDIPAYLFLGGLAGGSSLLAAGADRTGRPALRRTSRIGALLAITGSFAALVHDLGRPDRFVNMLRVAKPTSPMSMGTWLLTAYGPAAALGGIGELATLAPEGWQTQASIRRLGALARPAGMVAALLGPAVASYTAVLLSDTATPSWHHGYRQMPFVFAASAASAAGGLGLVGAPTDQASPARRMAIVGALIEVVAEQQMERSMGLTAEPLHDGRASIFLRTGKVLAALGIAGAAIGRGSRRVSAVAGLALLGSSACTRFAIFEAGQASALDPKYTVVPQRQRIDARGS